MLEKIKSKCKPGYAFLCLVGSFISSFFFFILSIIFWITAMTLAVMALKDKKCDNHRLAWTTIILGLIPLVFSILAVIVVGWQVFYYSNFFN